jgi:chromosome partition protein MukB
MRRVRARQIALVNWNGVFYERYLLDEHVTALEGINGAGKTTVMIAAYVVLLPDMTRLRFTNVGEGDATGGDRGLWGRLGESDRPSYAVVDFELPGEPRLVAGVRLERKGEPAVELSPFVISDLPEEVRLQDVLLLNVGEKEEVPELQELRENVARLGGRLHPFKTAKDYFSALFDRGITPLRLSTDEERKRFNDMLRTSMTGGISRSLTTEFRAFLLKEEGGLADTLDRMRGNLEACRRTRTEVHESRVLEQEISGVYAAGDAMFAAAMLAMRERTDELRRRLDEARHAHDDALRERDAVASQLGLVRDRLGDVERKLDEARRQLEVARGRQGRVEKANAIAKRLAELEGQLEGQREQLAAAMREQTRAEKELARHVQRLERAEDAYARAAKGLAALQEGLAELHRRADAHRVVTRRLGEVCSILGRSALDLDAVDTHLAELEERLAALDAERGDIDARLGTAEAHRREHAAVMQALSTIVRREVDPRAAHEEGRGALTRLAGLEWNAGQVDALAKELAEVRAKAERQRAARERAQALGEAEHPLATSNDVADALHRADAAADELEDVERRESVAAAEQRRVRDALALQHESLQQRLVRWRELDLVASRLERILGGGLRTRDELDEARVLLDEQRDARQRRHQELRRSQVDVHEQARALEQAGGAFHRELLALRDAVGGELLAGHLDDVAIDRAGALQARLGPLADAIVVDDARAAATLVRGVDRGLDTVWLVEGGAVRELADPGEIVVESGDVVVDEGDRVRVTRVPAKPTLGHRARTRRIAELRERAEGLAVEIAAVETELGELDARRKDLSLLLSEVGLLTLGDPVAEIDDSEQSQSRAEKAERRHRNAAEQAARVLGDVRRRRKALRELQAEAHLLDEGDLMERARVLHGHWRKAVDAKNELQRTHEARRLLSTHLDALRRLPLGDEEGAAFRERLRVLGQERQGTYLAQDGLRYVDEHREALSWSDAEAALAVETKLVPELTRQHENAARERDEARARVGEARERADAVRAARQDIEGRYKAVQAKRDLERAELETTGIEDASDEALARAASECKTLGVEVHTLDEQQRALGREVATLEERLGQREDSLRRASAELDAREKEWKPNQEAWDRLRERAEADGLLTPSVSARLLEPNVGSPNRNTQARTEGGRLEERLKTAKGGHEIIERVRTWLSPSASEQTVSEGYMQAWMVVRDWLRRRVPAQIAEVDDPLEALERLQHHLAALEQRLGRQESELRGASEDVARGIDVHIRKAQGHVRQLNRDLQGVRFGTILGMTIRLQRDERMEKVLLALREGPDQGMLFDTSMPIEQALEELFRRHGGGRTGGQRLLDYREYVQLAVEVRRQGSGEWEAANPSRMSTGEAIGVGAALMMVVLTAWERAANLFRGKRSVGTLRWLFLDEANRLSHDNLAVLFDLCSGLDLQLLIAAPEVAHGKGCTTYRLVRRVNEDGRPEVIATGRVAREESGDGDVGA